MPQDPSYWYRVPETGQVERMPWYDNTREPTDYEIDSYRSQSRQQESERWVNKYIPEPVKDAFNWASAPITDAPSRWARQIAPEGGKGFAGYGAITRFLGDTASSMTSPLNIGLTAVSGGAYGAGRLGLGATARALGGIEMAAGAGQVGLGGYHMTQAESMPEAAGAGLEMLFGGLGYMGGRGNWRGNIAPEAPPRISDPSRLLGAGNPDIIYPGAGPRFEAGPAGIGDLTNPNYVPGAAGGPGGGPAGRISIAGLGGGPEPAGPMPITDPNAGAALDLQLQQPVSPRGASGLSPFEHQPGVWNQFRERPSGQPMDLGGYQLDDPAMRLQTPEVPPVMEPPAPSRPATDFWREEIGRPAAPREIVSDDWGLDDLTSPAETTVTPRSVLESRVLGGEEPPPFSLAGRQINPEAIAQEAASPLSQFEPIHPEWMKAIESDPEILTELFGRARVFGIDVSKFNDLDELYIAVDDATPGPKMADAAAAARPVSGTVRPMNLPVESAQTVGGTGLPGPRVGQPPAPRTAAEARAYVEGLAQPTPAALPEPTRPLVQTPTPAPEVPAAPKKPTPDRVLRFARGMDDAVRVVFPDRLHADLFSAIGRQSKMLKGKPGIPPDWKGLAARMNMTEKEVSRIASDYRNRILTMTKALPKRAPEGTDVLDMEAPHWSGNAPEMVTTPKPVPISPERAAREANIEAAKAQISKQDAAEAAQRTMTNTPEELAAMEARHKAVQDAYAAEEAAAPDAATLVKGWTKGGITRMISELRSPNGERAREALLGIRFPNDDRTARELANVLEAHVATPKPIAAPTPKPELPKGKQARITAVMDKLTSAGTDLEALAADKARLLTAAKEAGIKSTTLKSAIQDWFSKAGGSETGALRVGPSEQRLAQMKALVGRADDSVERSRLAKALGRKLQEVKQIPTEKLRQMKIDEDSYQASLLWERAHGEVGFNPQDLADIVGDVTFRDINVEGFAGTIGSSKAPTKSNFQEFFRKIGGSETGQAALPSWPQLKGAARKTFDVANQVRMTSMLSGLALPKSLSGNVGAHLIAALEGKTLSPIKVLGNVKQIAQDIGTGWRAGANPASIGGAGKINLPGRIMGAADFAATQSLMRAGLTLKEAQELLLTNPSFITSRTALKDNPLVDVVMPFKKTPFNQFEQGLTRWKKHPDVYAAAVAVGALAGANIEDKEKLAMVSALAGPYAVPFLIGASLTGGKEALGGISPIPEWGITRTISDPFAAFTESPGRRWGRSNFGFGKEAAREKKIEEGKTIGRRTRSRRSRPSR